MAAPAQMAGSEELQNYPQQTMRDVKKLNSNPLPAAMEDPTFICFGMTNNEAFVVTRADTAEAAVRTTFANASYTTLAEAFDHELFNEQGYLTPYEKQG